MTDILLGMENSGAVWKIAVLDDLSFIGNLKYIINLVFSKCVCFI